MEIKMYIQNIHLIFTKALKKMFSIRVLVVRKTQLKIYSMYLLEDSSISFLQSKSYKKHLFKIP